MSREFMKDFLRDRNEGNYFFSAIKTDWARESLDRSENYVWSQRLNPSNLWFSMCPYSEVRVRAAGRSVNEPSSIQRMEVGKYLHTMLQDRAKNIEGLLWPKPQFSSKEDIKKLEENWPEVPFYWEWCKLSGRADLILNIKDKPVLSDLKVTTRVPNAWAALKKARRPEEKHLTQVCVAALALNEMGVYNQPIETVSVIYFNPAIDPKGDDGYKEFYLPFTRELQQMSKLVLEHNIKEQELYLAGKDSTCSYPHCKEHNK